MAERRTSRGKQDLTPDELAPAADEAPGAFTIVGVLGESPDAGSVRVFLDPQFQTYYEIPADAILRRTRVPAERSPLGVDSSAVVVRKGTELTVHRADTRRVEEEFLAGDFTDPDSFLPPPPKGGGPVVSFAGCPSDTEACVSGIVICPQPTLEAPCVFSQDIRCPASVGLCPPATDDFACTVHVTRDLTCITRGQRCLVTIDCPTRMPSRCCVSRPGMCRTVGVCPSVGGPCQTWICGFGGGGQLG